MIKRLDTFTRASATGYIYQGKKERIYTFMDTIASPFGKKEIINYLNGCVLAELPAEISYTLKHKAGGYKITHHPARHPNTGEPVENIVLKQF